MIDSYSTGSDVLWAGRQYHVKTRWVDNIFHVACFPSCDELVEFVHASHKGPPLRICLGPPNYLIADPKRGQA